LVAKTPSRPGPGVPALALLSGLFAVMDGVAQIIIGTRLRSNGQFPRAASYRHSAGQYRQRRHRLCRLWRCGVNCFRKVVRHEEMP